MQWRKLGRIFQASGQRPWMNSHASMPFAEPMDDGLLRIWFTPRDDRNRSHLAWLEIDAGQPQYVRNLADDPALAPGPAGRFDDAGTMGTWLVTVENERRYYYVGWSRHGPTAHHVAIGLAVCHDGGVGFSRHSPEPIFDRNEHDPFFVSNPCVLRIKDQWHMWYLSATNWREDANSTDYCIRRATSPNGLNWTPDPASGIDFAAPGECEFARPSVLIEDDFWRMWYCYRGSDQSRRIGYAESSDGSVWIRRDDLAGLSPSDQGWDSEMVAYPHVFDHDGARYMVYAGNGFGQGGMGLAVLDQD